MKNNLLVVISVKINHIVTKFEALIDIISRKKNKDNNSADVNNKEELRKSKTRQQSQKVVPKQRWKQGLLIEFKLNHLMVLFISDDVYSYFLS